MFEKYLKRNEPKDIGGPQPPSTAGSLVPTQSTQNLGAGVNRKRSKSRSSNIDKSLRLTTEQKCDIAQKEMDDLKDEIEKLKEDSEKVVDTYKVNTQIYDCNETVQVCDPICANSHLKW